MSAPVPPNHRPLPPATLIAVLILLAIPVAAILIVPIYASSGPEIDGWPFFYWYQMVWVVLTGAFTGLAYLLVKRARS